MLIIPAIDLKEGKCVRLEQGLMDKTTVYSDDPATTARHWESQGAEILHVVDLDGAFAGVPKNLDAIKAIRAAIKIPIEVGGGIRDMATIKTLVAIGIDRIILVTSSTHMVRAVDEFTAAGFEVTAAPAEMWTHDERGVVAFVPTVLALYRSHVALYEWAGRVARWL